MMKKIPAFYNSIFKIGISGAASLYIVFHGRKVNLLESLQTPAFYLALAVSFCVALLLVNIVDHGHRWLDERYDWVQDTVKRSGAQFVLCVLFPLMVDFVLLSIYFYFLGTNIFESGFIKHDFPLVVCFVLLINMYYITVSMFSERNVSTIENPVYAAPDEAPDKDKLLLEALCPAFPDKGLSIKDDVLYFFRNNKQVVLVAISGDEYPINTNLTFLTEQLSDKKFIRINRSVIINTRLITGYTNGEKRDTLILKLRGELNETFKHELKNRFIVTKNYISAVCRLF